MSTYAIVDTGQTSYYGSTTTITTPGSTAAFYGQDASYQGLQPSYTDNNNGTVTDRNTGLTWMKSVTSQEMTWEQAVAYAESAVIGGYDDWRLPSIKAEDRGQSLGLRSVIDGFRYLAGHKVLLMSFVVDIIAMLFGMPRALFPEIAHVDFGGPQGGGLAFAVLFAAIPVGSVLGGGDD